MSTISADSSANLKDNKIRVPKQDRAVKAKQAILEAAMSLFSDKGFHKTNSKEIAATAGVSIGTFYSYYPDKRELFKDALHVYNRRFNDELNAMLQGFDLSSKEIDRKQVLHRFVAGLMKAHSVYEGFHDELIIMHLSDPEMHEIVLAKHAESRENIVRYLESARSMITVKDLEAAAVILYDLVHSVVDTIIFKKTHLDGGRIVDALVDTMELYLFGNRTA